MHFENKGFFLSNKKTENKYQACLQNSTVNMQMQRREKNLVVSDWFPWIVCENSWVCRHFFLHVCSQEDFLFINTHNSNLDGVVFYYNIIEYIIYLRSVVPNIFFSVKLFFISEINIFLFFIFYLSKMIFRLYILENCI